MTNEQIRDDLDNARRWLEQAEANYGGDSGLAAKWSQAAADIGNGFVQLAAMNYAMQRDSADADRQAKWRDEDIDRIGQEREEQRAVNAAVVESHKAATERERLELKLSEQRAELLLAVDRRNVRDAEVSE